MSILLSDTGEMGFIEALRKNFPMALAGDDAAVLESLALPVVTTDSFFQGTHFHLWWAEPGKIARRLLEATLSDLAAMGAEPRWVFSSVMLPPEMELEWVLSFYGGLTSRNDCQVAGGETIRGESFGVTLTAIGECGENIPFRRSGAKPGDSLWVTGPLGRSYESPELLEKSRNRPLSAEEKAQTSLFLEPAARFDAVPALRRAGCTAAIDISDGLFSECRHIAAESSVGIHLEMDKVPLVEYCAGKPLEACSAGEDFELLFSLPGGAEAPGWHRIGSIISGEGLITTLNGRSITLPSSGYDHFLKN